MLFLEGIWSQELHSVVYMRHLTDLDQCIHEEIEYDDNCTKIASGVGSQNNESMGRVSSQVDDIIQGVTKRMQQMYGPSRIAKRRVERPYICRICGGNHPTGHCAPKNKGMVRQEPQQASWCNFHK